MEELFNEKQSLELITGIINKAKNNFSESGMLYLVWGITILFCSLAQFVLNSIMGYKNVYYVWFLTLPVYIYQVIFLYKKKKKETVKTYTDEIIGYV